MPHNLVYFDTSGNFTQKFSTSQVDDLAERVLRVMASNTYTGTITVSNTSSIGTFTDTALVGAAGSDNTAEVSNTYTLSQVSTATLGAASDPPMYVGLDTSTPPSVILQENLTTREQLADEIISRMVSGTGGTNAYYLGTSAPADGATWVSRGTLLDTKTNLTVTVTDYKLWHRTTSGASITNRDPVKLSSGNLQSFSTAEIQALIKTIEQRIVSTGIGTYVLQETVPATGTWVNAGTIIDTREDFTAFSYISDSGTYVGPGIYEGGYDSSFLGFIPNSAAYNGPGEKDFNVTYVGPPGPGATWYDANYFGFGVDNIQYVGTGMFLFSGTYDANFTGDFNYIGPINYDIGTVSPTTSTITTRTLWRRVA